MTFICSRCKEEKNEYKSRKRKFIVCTDCQNKITQQKKNEWKLNHKENNTKSVRKWQLNNFEKHQKYMKELNKKHSENLTDKYVNHLINQNTGMSSKDIPQFLTNLYRLHLQALRRIRNGSKESK